MLLFCELAIKAVCIVLVRDFSNGYIIAEIFYWYFPDDIEMHEFKTGNSIATKLSNWALLERFFIKRHLNLAKELIHGTIHRKPGAAEALIQNIYVILTSRKIKCIKDEKIDLTDTSYQKMLPMVARSTATKAVKNNIRITEIIAEPDTVFNQQKVQTILNRHLQHRYEERLENPKRFDIKPTLGELAVRIFPSINAMENMAKLLKDKRSKISLSSSSSETSKETVPFQEIQVKQATRSDMSADLSGGSVTAVNEK
uniref:Spermatogenesis-associated protein 4 isoform X2 n=1 Tax=Geotrypetes seraphini TaxID=260995 RepID=A0A6P8QIW2_GEOSA|nr:spermatogenesis-associated protein 4 isoform X2 [Geotrypetes seraphini]